METHLKTCLPGTLTSIVAGSILRRGCPLVGPYGSGTVFLSHADCHEAWVNITTDDGAEAVKLSELFLDLYDPIGMDVASRWLAKHYGLPIGATAPVWNRGLIGSWSLWSGRADLPFMWVEEPGELPLKNIAGLHSRIAIKGISKIADPVEALVITCLAAGTLE